jgi:hypothetical protein
VKNIAYCVLGIGSKQSDQLPYGTIEGVVTANGQYRRGWIPIERFVAAIGQYRRGWTPIEVLPK